MSCVNRVVIALAALTLAGCGLLPERSAAPPGAAGMEKSAPAVVEAPVSPDLQRAYDQALAALAAGRTRDAEQQLLALTRQAPELSGPYANLGLLYRRAGRNLEAIAALEHAVEINPKRAVYYNELGISYRLEGKFEKARGNYQKAIGLDPGYALAYLNLGILYDLYLQQPKDALPYYQRYRDLVPADASMISKWIVDLERRAGHKPPKEKS
jgi:Flp pilus assembly protein TadD